MITQGMVSSSWKATTVPAVTPNAGVVFSTSFAALLFAFALLLILSFVGRRRRGRG